MFPNRRHFLALTGASLSVATLPAAPALATSATRRFSVFLGRKQVGEASVSLSRNGARVEAEVNVELHLRILGLIHFDYVLSNRESWQDGVLQEMHATTDNNGSQEFVDARRTVQGLEVAGSHYQGIVSGNPATTSYFTTDFLERPTWISTQNGKLMHPSIGHTGITEFSTSEGDIQCSQYAIRNGIDIDLYYDNSFEWMGSSFNVAGRQARISMDNRGASLNRIWHG